MPTRQTSSSGRPKSPRIQVVLPEDLCDRLAVLAELEARTVSNMARVLIQQGVERLESLQGLEPGDPRAEAAGSGSRSLRPAPEGATHAERSRAASSGSPRDGTRRDRLENDRLEHDGPERDEAVVPRSRKPNEDDSGGFGRRDARIEPGASASSRGGAPARRNRAQGDPSRGNPSVGIPSVGSPSGARRSGDASFSADAFRAELERQGQEPAPRSQKPRRLRIWRPS